MKTFAQTISQNILMKTRIMKEFEVQESVIDNWAAGKKSPNPLLKKAILTFISDCKYRSEVPQELRDTKQRLVEKILNKYDPIGLIKLGAPEDEYSSEAKEIIHQLDVVKNINELSQTIWAIFVCSFDLSIAGPVNYYKLIAAEIWSIKELTTEEVYVAKAVHLMKDAAKSSINKIQEIIKKC
jgi:hypothetical protein